LSCLFTGACFIASIAIAITRRTPRKGVNHLGELNTNSSKFAGRSAYTIIGTYKNPSFGLQQLMETGTITGDKAYSVQYIADASKYADYLSIVQKMIGSLAIKNSMETGIGTR